MHNFVLTYLLACFWQIFININKLLQEQPANLFGSNGLCYILSHNPIDGQKDVASPFDIVNLSQLFDELKSRSIGRTFSSHLVSIQDMNLCSIYFCRGVSFDHP